MARATAKGFGEILHSINVFHMPKGFHAQEATRFLTLTATTEREQSFEDPALSTGDGFFTYFLVQAWRGNADNDPCDGVVSADELIEYVRSNVRRYARGKQLSQTPTARGDYCDAGRREGEARSLPCVWGAPGGGACRLCLSDRAS